MHPPRNYFAICASEAVENVLNILYRKQDTCKTSLVNLQILIFDFLINVAG